MEITYDTPAFTDECKQKTTYDVWREARELMPDKHVAVKNIKYIGEHIKATLDIRDKEKK